MKNCVWLKPQLVAQIEFTEWTPDGHLRHSKFVGLRDDKDPREVVRESQQAEYASPRPLQNIESRRHLCATRFLKIEFLAYVRLHFSLAVLRSTNNNSNEELSSVDCIKRNGSM